MSEVAAPGYPKLSLCIDGKFLRDARQSEPVINPATEAHLGELPHATLADLDSALAACARGFDLWRRVSAVERSRKLRRVADLIRARREYIATLITLELGKPYSQSLNETGIAAEMFEWAAEEGRRSYGRTIPARSPNMRLTVERVPVGPVAGFSGWNAPLITPSRKISGALGAGCSIVMKPAESTPAVALALMQCILDAEIPSSVVSMVFGDPALISGHLLRSPIIRLITFTGSVPVGKQLTVLAAQAMKRVIMELGGHATAVICDDADIDAAVSAAVTAKFRNSGQICVAPTRFFVQRGVYEEFVTKFAQAAGSLRVGNGFDPEIRMGPVANRRRLQVLQAMIADAVSQGAKIASGGERMGELGYFLQPTVLRDVPIDCVAMREEPFGPLALLRPFASCGEAVELANALPLALAGFVWTRDVKRTTLFREDLEVGTLGINHFTASWPETPFGGVKESGMGSEGGIEGLQAFQQLKFVSEA
jgi:succinate-semialdehyde dehydrogenase/glutarate-semialdehyde dehydrogenase